MVFAWIFFRAASFTEAFDVIGGILTLQGGVTECGLALPGRPCSAIVTIAIDIAQRNAGTHTPMLALTPVLQGALYGAFVVAIVLFSRRRDRPVHLLPVLDHARCVPHRAPWP